VHSCALPVPVHVSPYAHRPSQGCPVPGAASGDGLVIRNGVFPPRAQRPVCAPLAQHTCLAILPVRPSAITRAVRHLERPLGPSQECGSFRFGVCPPRARLTPLLLPAARVRQKARIALYTHLRPGPSRCRSPRPCCARCTRMTPPSRCRCRCALGVAWSRVCRCD
jgi:hypothetical protein